MINNEGEMGNIGDKSNLEKINPDFSFNDLLTAAQQEKWELVDKNISKFCDNLVAVKWALNLGIKNEDGNVRDFAVSILEKSNCKFEKQNIVELLQKLDQDENPYVRFRSAFALFTHGNRSEKVIQKIKEALEDDAVKEIAKEYLTQTNK